MLIFGKSAAQKWRDAVGKLVGGEMSVQDFVNLHEKKVLYYSAPFLAGEDGRPRPIALSSVNDDLLYFPVFSTPEALKAHFASIGRAEYILIKGTLRDALHALDAHPLLSEWGLVIDPTSDLPVGIPPQVRVQPKCLRR